MQFSTISPSYVHYRTDESFPSNFANDYTSNATSSSNRTRQEAYVNIDGQVYRSPVFEEPQDRGPQDSVSPKILEELIERKLDEMLRGQGPGSDKLHRIIENKINAALGESNRLADRQGPRCVCLRFRTKIERKLICNPQV